MTGPEKTHKLAEVFGINRDVPLNYVVRRDVDDVLIDNLTRDHHLIIHGSSKQGKTSLREHCLSDDDYIVVTCLNRWDIGELHAAILKKVGYRVQQSQKTTTTGKHKVEAEFVGEGGVHSDSESIREGRILSTREKVARKKSLSLSNLMSMM